MNPLTSPAVIVKSLSIQLNLKPKITQPKTTQSTTICVWLLTHSASLDISCKSDFVKVQSVGISSSVTFFLSLSLPWALLLCFLSFLIFPFNPFVTHFLFSLSFCQCPITFPLSENEIFSLFPFFAFGIVSSSTSSCTLCCFLVHFVVFVCANNLCKN